jgi:hypothetical protein
MADLERLCVESGGQLGHPPFTRGHAKTWRNRQVIWLWSEKPASRAASAAGMPASIRSRARSSCRIVRNRLGLVSKAAREAPPIHVGEAFELGHIKTTGRILRNRLAHRAEPAESNGTAAAFMQLKSESF